MRHIIVFGVLFVTSLVSYSNVFCTTGTTSSLPGVAPEATSANVFPAPLQGCLASKCHEGIEPLMDHDSRMMKQIFERGARAGDRNGCVVCHGGNPAETEDKEKAHSGAPPEVAIDVFARFAGSMWINDKTCGECHPKHAYAMHRSSMNTDAGKMKAVMWGWGIDTDYRHRYGNYGVEDVDGGVPVFGTEAYKEYMVDMARRYPGAFPPRLEQLPEPDVDTIKENPQQAVYTYLRSCQRCHVGVRGGSNRGDHRGMGCAACHIPYSNEGFYEGNDPSILKDESGHLLVHTIQSSRRAKVVVNEKIYSGIPPSTCATCHSSGRRIGVSFQGLMTFPYNTPYDVKGQAQMPLHGNRYLYIQEDQHHSFESREGNPQGGLTCQDCHTTTSMHGNGNIGATTLATVEVECVDCHGTVDRYPWELPAGFGDEFGKEPDRAKARGLADSPMEIQGLGTGYPARDGYLLTSRGNPFGNVVKDGDDVILHSATGLDFKVPALKRLARDEAWQNPLKAKTAMARVTKHLETLECYACHSTWAPQYYGFYLKVDYSGDNSSVDWIKSGSTRKKDGNTAESGRDGTIRMQKGKGFGGYVYSRWEEPVLGMNGEGRVSPLVGVLQQITSVVAPDEEIMVQNKIWRTSPGIEGGGGQGQRCIDLTPVNPHSVTKAARECVDCHASPKAQGYGTHYGKYMDRSTHDIYADVTGADYTPVGLNSKVQIAAVSDLPMNLAQIVNRDGGQLQTVGYHWPLSGPLTRDQREHVERAGVCIACHQDIPDGSMPMAVLGRIADMGNIQFRTDRDHSGLLRQNNIYMAWIKVAGGVGIVVLFVLGLLYLARRHRSVPD